MSSLPEINERVDVRVRNGDWFASRIEDRDGNTLHVAQPDGVDAGRDTPVTVRWVTDRGVAEVPGTIDGSAGQGAMSVWRVRTAGDPAVQQRRRFVRARVFLHVTIEFEEGLGLQRVPCSSVDLSEGGIQVVTLGEDDIAVGRAVDVVIDLEGDEIRLAGDVIQSRARPDGNRTVIVRFVGVREGDADRIRRFVFQSQLDSTTKDRA